MEDEGRGTGASKGEAASVGPNVILQARVNWAQLGANNIGFGGTVVPYKRSGHRNHKVQYKRKDGYLT